MKKAIVIENLTKNYGDLKAVDNISFYVEEGSLFAFLGPNGAGKSTTMNILTGFLSFTDGKVEVDGLDILDYPNEAKKNIGYLPEQPPLYLDMTVTEYLNFVYELKSCTLNKKKHIAEIIEVVKLTDVKNRLIGNLSKGYRQRVGIGQALVGNPKVIILDEPTRGIDAGARTDVYNIIKGLSKKGLAVLLISSDMEEIIELSDRAVTIHQGRLNCEFDRADINQENLTKASFGVIGKEKES